MDRPRSAEMFDRARRLSPGGVHSPVRAFGSVEGTPVFFARGAGSRVWDVDGHEYVDFCMSWGPLVLGHAYPAVIEAVCETARRGLSFGACHEGEVALAETLLAGFPKFDRVRFVSSGTEAVMTSLRLARGATGRRLVLKFEGGYHGHSDALLVKAGSGLATMGIATTDGVPEDTARTTLVLPFDDDLALALAFREHGDDLACVIVEPVPANNGLLRQRPEWLAELRRLCDRHGTLLIFDEVITGFRVRYGSVAPVVGVEPDLVTLGKIVGGGLPVGAVTGPAELLDLLAPAGRVYQAGTLSGNPVSMAAGRATLEALRDGTVHDRLEELGARLEEKLTAGAPEWLQVQRVGSIVWPYLAPGPLPRRADTIDSATIERFRPLHGRLLDRGYYLPPAALEVLFLSAAHAEDEIDAFAAAVREEVQGLG